MYDSDEEKSVKVSIDVIIAPQVVESSEEPPMDEWSSLEIIVPEINRKKILHEAGLYDAGSGEICTKYITMSNSSVFTHPYYRYPAITDPGIEEALLKPPKLLTYADDGQDLYLDICKEMNQYPVRSFYKGLLGSQIDLRYYCVNPYGIRAMAEALRYNKTVKIFNLTDNFLNDDSCYHLSDMLLTNKTLTNLILYGCKIGPDGAKRLFSSLPHNRGLKCLDLTRNQLGDEGVEHLANAIDLGLDLNEINLSYNNITGKGVAFLTEVFDIKNTLTHINLSWNKLFTPGTYGFLLKLSESTCLQVLDLSWNSLAGPRISLAIKEILLCSNLKELNLSNNKLEGEAITNIIGSITKAKKLMKFDLSFNPLSPVDALSVLTKVRSPASKLKQLIMDNISVTVEFVSLLERIKGMKSKKNLVVTHGDVRGGFIAKGPDPRELALNRVEYITKKPKKNKVDFALIALQLQKNYSVMNIKEFAAALQAAGASLDDGLVEELVNIFPGPKSAKIKYININVMVEYIQRKWPDRKLPPTPPPEPEPVPEPAVSKARGKGKGKK